MQTVGGAGQLQECVSAQQPMQTMGGAGQVQVAAQQPTHTVEEAGQLQQEHVLAQQLMQTVWGLGQVQVAAQQTVGGAGRLQEPEDSDGEDISGLSLLSKRGQSRRAGKRRRVSTNRMLISAGFHAASGSTSTGKDFLARIDCVLKLRDKKPELKKPAVLSAVNDLRKALASRDPERQNELACLIHCLNNNKYLPIFADLYLCFGVGPCILSIDCKNRLQICHDFAGKLTNLN
jgi:hypothetical protein